jgi:hypothetical protein
MEMRLQYASDDLKADKEVVLAAVTQNGNALQYASEDLKADKEVVLAAVTQNGMRSITPRMTSRLTRRWCSRPWQNGTCAAVRLG